MRKFLLLMFAVFLTGITQAQISGTYTIPGGTYPTIASAIAAINTSGIGAGGVTFNVNAGYTETFASPTAGYITTNTATAANPVIFQKAGTGANPKITAGVGTGTLDAVICFSGVKYITFDGIDVYENAANTTTTTQMEWGYALLKASGTQGSQNITVKNCTISLNNTNTATYAFYSNNHTSAATASLTVTAATGTNSNNKIFGNSITNCYGAIYLYGFSDVFPYAYYDQNNEIGKDGPNTVTNVGNTTTPGSTSIYVFYIYYQNNLKLANNTITGTASFSSGSCYNFYVSTCSNSNLDIYNNTVSLNYVGTGSFYGMYVSGGASGVSNTVNIYNNNIVNNTLPNATSGTFYMMYLSTGGVTANCYGNNISNNTIGSATATATGSLYYLYFASSPTTAGTANFYNNTVQNNQRIQSVVGSGSTYLLYNGGNGLVFNEYGNLVNNITIGSNSATYGLYNLYSGLTKNVYNNTVSNILNCNSTIYTVYNGNGTGNAYFYNNKLFNINMASTSASIYGYYQSSGTNVYYYNNFASDLKAPTSTATGAIYGMYISGGTYVGAYYNTIYLNATSSSATTFGTVGLYASTTPVTDLRNNIIVNTSTPVGATGYTQALRFSTTTLTNYNALSNNNCLYAGTPGPNNLIFYDGTNMDQTLAAYKTRVWPRDYYSVSENPPFVNVATTPYDLHLKNNVATQCESGGVAISTPFAVTQDFDAQNRFPNAGYPVGGFTPKAPDMGADEVGGLNTDLTPPVISFTPLTSTSSTSARVLTTSIFDVSGVPASGAGLPVLYWRINTGSWNSVPGTFVSGNTYTFTFGAGVVTTDVVSYYIVAQDMAGTPNIGVIPLPGTSALTANPPASATPPTTPYSYTIFGTICGTKTVGTGGDYANLTAALADFNTKEMTCPVVFSLLSTYSSTGETFPLVINRNPGASAVNTLTIKPAAGATVSISGTSASSQMIRILNPFTTIDGSNTAGGTTRNLTINNTSATAPQVVLIGSTGTTPITDVTLKNTIIINGANTSSAVVVSDGTTSGSSGYFNNITIQNNSIQLAYMAMYINAIVSAGNGSGLLVTGNDLNTSGANSIRLVGVYVQGVDGATVSNNNIGNMSNAVDASNMTGIWLATGTINTTLSGNNLVSITSTTGAPRGIAVSSGLANSNITVTGNTISTVTTSYSAAIYGIYVFSTTSGVTVSKNTVNGIQNSNTSGYATRAIYFVTGLPNSNINVINNNVYDITGSSDVGSTFWNSGIGFELGTGGANVWHNTVNLAGTFAGKSAATGSAAFIIGNLNSTFNIRDNIFVNTYDNSTVTTDRAYAIYAFGTGATINYNDYYVSGAAGILGYLGADMTTLAAWQTATGQDAASQNINPTFVSASDLHPTNVALDNKGVYISSVPTDYSNATRYNPPDMGSYEFGTTPAAWVNTDPATVVTSTGATLNGNGAGNGSTVNVSFEYGLTTAYGTPATATPVSLSGIPTTTFTSGISGLTPYTLYHYRAKGQVGAGSPFYGVDQTFTTTAVVASLVTTAATGVTSSGATLNGTCNANNASTTVVFEWGLTTAYTGGTVAGTPGTVTGTTVTPVNGSLTGLLPNTTYHYRIKGTNIAGDAYGLDQTFTTPVPLPTVTTDPASNITTNGAQMNGTVNANGFSSTVTFEYGLTTAYGTIVAATPGTVTGSTATAVMATLTGLLTNTTYHYKVCATNAGGQACGGDQTFLTGCPPVAPAGVITGPASVCAGSSGKVYSVSPITNATGYSWSVPAGASITAGNNTTSITVTFGSTTGSVSVFGTGPCGNGTPSSLPVTVNPLPVPTVTGNTTACQGSTNNTYTTQSGMTGYTWTVSAGGTITSGATTNSVVVTWSTTGTKTVSCTYTNANGCVASAPGTLNVTVNPAPAPTVTGSNSLCVNSGYYTYTTESGFTNYTWTISAGGIINFGSGTNSVMVSWINSGPQWIAVNYSNGSGCSAATPTTYNVTVNPPPSAAGAVTGTASVCGGQTGVAYSTPAISGAISYVWTLPVGATISSGAGTNNIMVDFAPDASSGNITVYGNNLCGNGAVSPNYAVTVTPLPVLAGEITGDNTVCEGTTNVTYSVPTIANATGYNWSVPTGATIVTGTNTSVITVDFPAGAMSGTISVFGTNTCGNGGASNLGVTVNPVPAAPVITVSGTSLTSSAASGNQWYFSSTQGGTGTPIAGATSQTYTPTQTGYYWSVVTINECSSDPSNVEYVIIEGISEPLAGNFNLFPVPNDGKFSVTISGTISPLDVTVINSVGMKIYQNQVKMTNGTYEIDLRPVAAGIYSVIFSDGQRQMVRKIVVK